MSEAFGEAKHDPKRRIRQGHSLKKWETSSGVLHVHCKCGWSISSILPDDMLKAAAERSGWTHISEPELLLLSSSDIEKYERLRRTSYEDYKRGQNRSE